MKRCFLQNTSRFRTIAGVRRGFLAASYGDASGYFGDGKAAMHLMGDWDYGAMKDNSASKTGIPDDQLGILPFPTIEGGAGDPSDTKAARSRAAG